MFNNQEGERGIPWGFLSTIPAGDVLIAIPPTTRRESLYRYRATLDILNDLRAEII